MADARFGPRLNVDASCFGCGHQRSTSYRVQGDSGHDIYCDHPEAEGRQVGDSSWRTPDWCPLGAHMLALRAALDMAPQPSPTLMDGPAGPEFIAQPDLQRLGFAGQADTESRN